MLQALPVLLALLGQLEAPARKVRPGPEAKLDRLAIRAGQQGRRVRKVNGVFRAQTGTPVRQGLSVQPASEVRQDHKGKLELLAYREPQGQADFQAQMAARAQKVRPELLAWLGQQDQRDLQVLKGNPVYQELLAFREQPALTELLERQEQLARQV